MSIRNRITRTLMAGAVMACCASPAHAIVAVLSVGDALPFGDSHSAGTFSDVVSFELAGPGSVTALAAPTNVLPFFNITGFTMTLTAAAGGPPLASASRDGNLMYVLVAPPLLAGAYHLNLSGNAVGSSGGFYGGSLVATAQPTAPVPEPEIWAMMAIGARLVGFQVRRKQKKTAIPSPSLA